MEEGLQVRANAWHEQARACLVAERTLSSRRRTGNLRYDQRVMGGVLEAVDRDRLAKLCRRHGIARLALFGSAARGELEPESDVDLLVEFLPGERVGLRFITVQEELQALLGRRVDLNTLAFLSPHFRDRVEAEAVPLYEAA